SKSTTAGSLRSCPGSACRVRLRSPAGARGCLAGVAPSVVGCVDAMALEDFLRHFPELDRFALDIGVVAIMLRTRDVVGKGLIALGQLELVAGLFENGDRTHEVVDGFAFVTFPSARPCDFAQGAQRDGEVGLAANLPIQIDRLPDATARLLELASLQVSLGQRAIGAGQLELVAQLFAKLHGLCECLDGFFGVAHVLVSGADVRERYRDAVALADFLRDRMSLSVVLQGLPMILLILGDRKS